MPEVVPVVLYARISEDTTGEAAGVRRQLEAARELAAGRGWHVVEECKDNDISALRGVRRPGYARVLELVQAGAVRNVVVWQTSRLLRSRKERAEAIELFGAKKVSIITVKGQDLDLSTAYGRGMAGMLGEFDTMESEVKSERVIAAAADRASRGVPNGGLGYGWTRRADGCYEVEPEQANVVGEIVRRLLGGETLLAVTRDLNDRAVAAPQAKMWGKTSVKKVVMRSSNAGLRIHHRGRDSERTFEGSWPPLVSIEEWEQVRALLGDPRRRSNGAVRPGARKHLLTWGVGECGVCGAHLRVSMKGNQTYGSKQLLYVCEAKGCVGRNQARVDELVAGIVVNRLMRPDMLAIMADGRETDRQAAANEAAAIRSRLDDAADRYADGMITVEQLERITRRLRPQLDAADVARGVHLKQVEAGIVADVAGPDAENLWGSKSVSQQRAVLEALGLRVRVMRTSRKGPGFDPASVSVEWKSS